MAKGQPHSPSKRKYSRRPPRINPYKLFCGAMVPNWLMCRTEISMGAKVLYARLMQYAGDDGLCFPGQDELSQALGVSERNVRNYLAELIAHKLIEKVRTGLRKTNRYYFLDHRWLKSAAPLPSRPEHQPTTPNRKNPAALDRKNPAALDRKNPAALDRQNPVVDDASKPRATKPSGRVRESVVRESAKENQTTTTPTPPITHESDMAPRFEDVGGVDDFAVAPGEEAKTTDGSMAARFQTFRAAYPNKCGNPDDAEQVWIDLNPDDTLYATMMVALEAWDKIWARDGYQRVPLAANWLRRRLWEDKRVQVRPVSPSARPYKEWSGEEPEPCHMNGDGTVIYPVELEGSRWCRCGDVVGMLSERRCDSCAREKIREETSELWEIAYHERPPNVKERLYRVLSGYHPTDADRFMTGINWEWDGTPDSLAEAIEQIQWQVMADARDERRLMDAAENILAVVRAQRQYGGLDLDQMISNILEERALSVGTECIPWQAWQSGPEPEIPTVEALVDLIREASGRHGDRD
jgi:hypothetical protein